MAADVFGIQHRSAARQRQLQRHACLHVQETVGHVDDDQHFYACLLLHFHLLN